MKTLPPLQHELALKAIAWDCDKRLFVSPSRPGFVWEQLGLATATCYKVERYPEQYPDHEIPDENCSCGMYCSFRKYVVDNYMGNVISVICLVEAYGKTILYHGGQAGFLSKQMLIRSVIDLKDANPREKLASFQAAEYFNVPRVEEEKAIAAMDLWNMRLNEDWPDWYKPESKYLKDLPVEDLKGMIEKCP